MRKEIENEVSAWVIGRGLLPSVYGCIRT